MEKHDKLVSVLERLKEKFPDVSFVVEYCEYGSDSFGYVVYHNSLTYNENEAFYSLFENLIEESFQSKSLCIGLTYGESYLPELVVYDEQNMFKDIQDSEFNKQEKSYAQAINAQLHNAFGEEAISFSFNACLAA